MSFSSKGETSTLFKSCNGLGIFTGLWGTIPSIQSYVKKLLLYFLILALLHKDFSYSLCYSLIRQTFL